jgi:predicted Rossmann fold nucleotide-binding protein DprA/Smf involved in DNA uptake
MEPCKLKKGHKPKYTRPMSNMRVVLNAVEIGCTSRRSIIEECGLSVGKVSSALWNLSHHGMIVYAKDAQGRGVYAIPGAQAVAVARCLCGVSSIFNVRYG